MSRNDVDNSENILDGRDVIARQEELQAERDSLEAALKEAKPRTKAAREAKQELAEWDRDYGEELKNLDAFVNEGSSEWRHGCTLVREDHFEDFAREEAEQLGLVRDDAQWPCNCIDWERAARELQHDYTGADFDGVTYYYRS